MCKSNEVTCSSSTLCLPRSKRCNREADCPDESDEEECSIAIIPEGYSSEKPPPGRNRDSPVTVSVFLSLSSVMNINVKKFSLELNGEFQFWWRDSRIMYRNLRDFFMLNQIKHCQVLWQPKLYIVDATKGPSKITTTHLQLFVLKETQPLPEDYSSIYEGNFSKVVISLCFFVLFLFACFFFCFYIFVYLFFVFSCGHFTQNAFISLIYDYVYYFI